MPFKAKSHRLLILLNAGRGRPAIVCATMEDAMKASDVMTGRVISIEPTATVAQGVRLMLQHRISGLPVVDNAGRLVGIVTEGDFLRRGETGTQRRRPRWLEFLIGPGKLADEYVRTHGRKIEEIMTLDPVTVREDTPLEDIVQLMEKRRIKRVPVLRGQTLVGVVSRANLLHALASIAAEAKPTAADDQAIRERLLAELNRQAWAPVSLVNVVVRNGVVELWGAITDERERRAFIVAAENIPGVKDVQDHLAWVEPTTGLAFFQSDEEVNAAKAS
jgi:CBS domain-containing protein